MSDCSHKFVDSTVCLKCGVSFAALKAATRPWRVGRRIPIHLYDAQGKPLGTMLTAVDAEFVVARVNANAPATPRQLHDALDTLLAEFIGEDPGRLPSKTSVVELLAWNATRLP